MPSHFRAVDNAVEKVRKVKEYVDNGLGVTLDVALDLEEVSKDNELVKELEDTMLQYVSMEREMDQCMKAVELAKEEFNRKYDVNSDDSPNIEDIFKEKLSSLEKNSKVSDLDSHPKVKEFREKLWNIHHQGEPMPQTNTQPGTQDEDIIMSQAPVELRSMMFLRLAVLFCVVCLASSEKEKNSEDPPGLLQALNSKYFGHIRGKRTGKDDNPPLEQALNNAYFGHIRGKRTQSDDHPPLEEALNSAYFGHIRGKRTGGWGSNKDLLEALNNAYMGHIRGKRQQETMDKSV